MIYQEIDEKFFAKLCREEVKEYVSFLTRRNKYLVEKIKSNELAVSVLQTRALVDCVNSLMALFVQRCEDREFSKAYVSAIGDDIKNFKEIEKVIEKIKNLTENEVSH